MRSSVPLRAGHIILCLGIVVIPMRFPILLFICMAALIVPICAHAPLSPGVNEDLPGATVISDPLKSWVVYGHLHEAGDTAYFRLDMQERQRLVLALNVNSAGAPVPDLIVMGPGIESSGIAPPSLEIPPGSGVLVIPGTRPASAGYEAFSPSALYEVAAFTTVINETGTYYAAVYTPEDDLSYSFVAGYKEEFTAAEWLTVPLSVIGIYLWEGQSPLFVAAPYLVVIAAGLGILYWQQKRTKKSRTIPAWIASIAALLFIGTGASTINQMLWVLSFTGYSPESTITLVFAAIPFALGIVALWVCRKGRIVTIRDRVVLLVIGGLGLVFWAGLIAGPVLLVLAAALPEKWGV
jgi:hypothetical protein